MAVPFDILCFWIDCNRARSAVFQDPNRVDSSRRRAVVVECRSTLVVSTSVRSVAMILEVTFPFETLFRVRMGDGSAAERPKLRYSVSPPSVWTVTLRLEVPQVGGVEVRCRGKCVYDVDIGMGGLVLSGEARVSEDRAAAGSSRL